MKAVAASLFLAGLAVSVAQGTPHVDVARLDYGLAARALAPGVWVVEGANADFSVANGCNIINTGFIATGKGVVVINTGPSKRYGEQLRALISRTTNERLRTSRETPASWTYRWADEEEKPYLRATAFWDMPAM